MPNSAIKDNIRNITKDFSNIVAIFKKQKNEKQYSKITYIKRNFDLTKLTDYTELTELINLNKINYDNEQDLINYNKVKEFKNSR